MYFIFDALHAAQPVVEFSISEMSVWGKRKRNGISTTPQVDIGSDEDRGRRNRTGVRSTCAAQCETQKIQASGDAEERERVGMGVRVTGEGRGEEEK